MQAEKKHTQVGLKLVFVGAKNIMYWCLLVQGTSCIAGGKQFAKLVVRYATVPRMPAGLRCYA